MYSSLAANSSAVITTNLQNTIQDLENNVKEPKTKRNFGMNLTDLSSKLGPTLPSSEDTSEPLLESTANAVGGEGGGQLLNSDSYVCGLPVQSFDRYLSGFV